MGSCLEWGVVKMNKLLEASAITIIGGADGPTSIYVSSGAKWQLILILLIILRFLEIINRFFVFIFGSKYIFIFFFIFGIIRLIQNIKKHKTIRTIAWSVVLFLMISVVVLTQVEKKHYENILQTINDQQLDDND